MILFKLINYMEIKELPKNSHFFILGTNCAFTGLTDHSLFSKGPIDNADCLGPRYINALFDGTYLNKLLHFNKEELVFNKDPYDGSLDGCYHLFSENLGVYFVHNEYNLSFIKNQIKRYNNFKEFCKKLPEENYYFVLNLFVNKYQKNFLDWADVLEKNNIMDKTIVFGNKDYKDNFKNFIIVPCDNKSRDDWLKNVDFILTLFNKYILN